MRRRTALVVDGSQYGSERFDERSDAAGLRQSLLYLVDCLPRQSLLDLVDGLPRQSLLYLVDGLSRQCLIYPCLLYTSDAADE